MSGIPLETLKAADRACDMWTLRGVWDAYGLWANTVLYPHCQFSVDEKGRRETARGRWHGYVMQEREKQNG